jgi:hypothetical protein
VEPPVVVEVQVDIQKEPTCQHGAVEAVVVVDVVADRHCLGMEEAEVYCRCHFDGCNWKSRLVVVLAVRGAEWDTSIEMGERDVAVVVVFVQGVAVACLADSFVHDILELELELE